VGFGVHGAVSEKVQNKVIACNLHKPEAGISSRVLALLIHPPVVKGEMALAPIHCLSPKDWREACSSSNQ
jgi:hypothetical protein